MKQLVRNVHKTQYGFTLIDLIVVIAIIGLIAGITVPNAARFLESGKNEAYETELLEVKTALGAMLRDSRTRQISSIGPTSFASSVTTTDITPLKLQDYMKSVTSEGKFKSGCTYIFGSDGSVSQFKP